MTKMFWRRSNTFFPCGRKLFLLWRVIERNVIFETWDEHRCQAGKAYGKWTVEVFFNFPMTRDACELTEDEFMPHIDALMRRLNVFATCGSYRAVETLKQLELKTASFGNVTEVLILKSRQFSNPWNVLFWLLFISEIFFPSFIVLQQHFLPSLCNLIVRSFSKKHLNNFFSTRSECLCFYSPFVRFESEITAQSMFINWRTLNWCQCITVRTKKEGTKLNCAYCRTKTVIVVW